MTTRNQGAYLYFALCVLLFSTSSFAQNIVWTETIAPRGVVWNSVATSSDTSVMGAAGSGGVFVTTNSGVTWTQSNLPVMFGDANIYWSGMCISSDGSKMFATSEFGTNIIVLSTNSGSTWRSVEPAKQDWNAIACSSDAKLVFAAVRNGGIFVSTNSGDTWTQSSAPTNWWRAITCSANGLTVVAVVGVFEGGGIFVSTNAGNSWVQASAPIQSWVSIASSSDGAKLVATSWLQSNPGNIYLSTNSGNTWIQASAPISRWGGVASSSDGTKLVAPLRGGGIYFSSNSGASWMQTQAAYGNWQPIACSANGTRILVADGAGGGVFIGEPSAPTVLVARAIRLDFTNTFVGGSYQLQMSSDLESWSNYGESFTAQASTNSIYIDVGDWSAFFRLRIVH